MSEPEFLMTKRVPVHDVLCGARDLLSVFVVGRDASGNLQAFASGFVDEHLADIARFKKKLKRGDYNIDDAKRSGDDHG